jgi:hypothetical protein
MLGCERCTLTHSPGAAVLLPLPLVTGLGLELGLVVPDATRASSVAAVPVDVAALVAVAVAVAVVVAVAVAVAVAVPAGVPVAVLVTVGDGVRSGPWLRLGDGDHATGGSVVWAEWLADGLVAGGLVEGELVEGELVEGDGDREGEGESDREGDGEGVGVPEDGSAWHTVSVFAAVVRGAACAVPRTPRVRKLPLSKVTAVTLTCAKRMRDRLSTLLVRVTVCSSGFVGDSGMDGYAGTHFR